MSGECGFYDKEETIQKMSTQYSFFKEREFIKYAFKNLDLAGKMLEVGGGTGFHGKLISQDNKIAYFHADYSHALCVYAHKAGLTSVRVDGLKLPFPDNSMDNILAIELSTLIHGEAVRFRQFDEFYRVTRTNGYLILETGIFKKGLHHLNRRDIHYLEARGFEKVAIGRWGGIPGRFWNIRTKRAFGRLERLLSSFEVGIRKVGKFRKR